jgi:ribosome maturation factor RimP
LRIDIDRPGMPGVGIADCELMSRTLGDRIEDVSFFEDSYDLQVSSPGLDRPIRTDADLRRNAGRPVRVEFKDERDKVLEIHGTLLETPGPEDVRIAVPDGEIQIARESILLMKQDVPLRGRKRKGP